MRVEELIAFVCYFFVLCTIVFFSCRKYPTYSDFILGSRSLNSWLTALSVHASDMSAWLFMGYPALIFSRGVFNVWIAVGLLVFMYLNWRWVAPKIRIATEQYNSLTLCSFFENRFADTSGKIRLFTALISFFFYTIYISAGWVGLGLLFENLFHLPYTLSVLVGVLSVVPYVFFGGYATLARIQLFQGFFLLGVVLFVPLFMWGSVGGWQGIYAAGETKQNFFSLFPQHAFSGVTQAIILAASWGLGYFGQPHLITKFMGIRSVREINRAKWMGMSWMCLSLAAATLVGLVGMAFFSASKLQNPELMFIHLVTTSFSPFFVGLILCAILAATTNAMSAQILVISSNLAEDVYKRLFRRQASPQELLISAKSGVMFVAFTAFFIAYHNPSSIYSLVFYAWSGLGATFGPLLLLSLYWKKTNQYGAWAGMIAGGGLYTLWPLFHSSLPSLIPGFFCSLALIVLFSLLTKPILYRQ